MKQYSWATLLVLLFLSEGQANTISDDEASKVAALSNKFIEFKTDIDQISGQALGPVVTELTPSIESRKTMLCLIRLEHQANYVERSFYGVRIATSISSFLHDPVDEKFSLMLVEHDSFKCGHISQRRSDGNK